MSFEPRNSKGMKNITILKTELLKLLETAYEEGWYGSKDMGEAVAQKLVENIKTSTVHETRKKLLEEATEYCSNAESRSASEANVINDSSVWDAPHTWDTPQSLELQVSSNGPTPASDEVVPDPPVPPPDHPAVPPPFSWGNFPSPNIGNGLGNGSWVTDPMTGEQSLVSNWLPGEPPPADTVGGADEIIQIIPESPESPESDEDEDEDEDDWDV